jgi:hypothetical protein
VDVGIGRRGPLRLPGHQLCRSVFFIRSSPEDSDEGAGKGTLLDPAPAGPATPGSSAKSE